MGHLCSFTNIGDDAVAVVARQIAPLLLHGRCDSIVKSKDMYTNLNYNLDYKCIFNRQNKAHSKSECMPQFCILGTIHSM